MSYLSDLYWLYQTWRNRKPVDLHVFQIRVHHNRDYSNRQCVSMAHLAFPNQLRDARYPSTGDYLFRGKAGSKLRKRLKMLGMPFLAHNKLDHIQVNQAYLGPLHLHISWFVVTENNNPEYALNLVRDKLRQHVGEAQVMLHILHPERFKGTDRGAMCAEENYPLMPQLVGRQGQDVIMCLNL